MINRLSTRKVELAQLPGRYGDGSGLYLNVASSGRKQWVFRHRFSGARRDTGLGAAGKGGVSLAQARSLAAVARMQIADGSDLLANVGRSMPPNGQPVPHRSCRHWALSPMKS